MPTYDYQCEACGHTFEEFQSITAAPLKKCPACKKNKVKRLIGTGAGFIFKGSGFYLTDYRSESYKQAAKADTEKVSSSKPAETSSSTSTNNGSSSSGGSTEAKKPTTQSADTKASK